MQVSVRCTGDSVSGDGKKNVTLAMDPTTQGGIGSANDTYRFTVDPSDPDFGTFVKGTTYTVTIS